MYAFGIEYCSSWPFYRLCIFRVKLNQSPNQILIKIGNFKMSVSWIFWLPKLKETRKEILWKQQIIEHQGYHIGNHCLGLCQSMECACIVWMPNWRISSFKLLPFWLINQRINWWYIAKFINSLALWLINKSMNSWIH